MTLLPVRVLPVNDAPSGSFLIRVDMDTRAAAIYVCDQSKKKTWVCNVSSLQEILAPTQQARALDLLAVVTCLYNGAAHDKSSSSLASSVDLVRREVAFTQPASWSGDSYRLTARIAVRTTSGVTSAAMAATPLEALAVDAVENVPAAMMDAAAIAVAEPADEDVVFGFNFTACDANIGRIPVDFTAIERRSVRLEVVGVGFPLRFLNWLPSTTPALALPVRDGVLVPPAYMEATLTIVHMKGPVHFVLSVGVAALKPHTTTTYQPSPTSHLCHTVAQYALTPTSGKSILQVAMLHGSAYALEGTTLYIRDEGAMARKTVLEDRTYDRVPSE